MLGMHGTSTPTTPSNEADLLIAFGVRFDDRVTGKVEEFAKHGKIVHVDIDPSEINKNKAAHIPIVSDVKYALAELNKIVEPPDDMSAWVEQCAKWKKSEPFHYDQDFAGILPQHAISELWQADARSRPGRSPSAWASIRCGPPSTTSSRKPRTLALLQRPGHDGLRPARGDGRAEPAHPDRLVIDIDGDGSFLMNIQELATCFCEKLPVKVLLLEQPAPGHGRAVGRPLPCKATGPTPTSARSTIPKRSAKATASARSDATRLRRTSPRATAAARPRSQEGRPGRRRSRK